MVKRTILNKRNRSTKKTPVQRRTSKRKNRVNRRGATFNELEHQGRRKSSQLVTVLPVPVEETAIKMPDEKEESEVVEITPENRGVALSVIEISDDENELSASSVSKPQEVNDCDESCFIIDVEPGIDECDKNKTFYSYRASSGSVENTDDNAVKIIDLNETVPSNSSFNLLSTGNPSASNCPNSAEKEILQHPNVTPRHLFFKDYRDRLNGFQNNNWKTYKKNLNQSPENTSSENSLDKSNDSPSVDVVNDNFLNTSCDIETQNVSDNLSTNQLDNESPIPSINRHAQNSCHRSLRRSKLRSLKRYNNVPTKTNLLNSEEVNENELNNLSPDKMLSENLNRSQDAFNKYKLKMDSTFKRKRSRHLNIALQKMRALLNASSYGSLDEASTSNINNLQNSSVNSEVSEKPCESSENLINSDSTQAKESSETAISVDSDSDIEFVNEYNPSEQFIELSDSENHLPAEIPLPKKAKVTRVKKKFGAKKTSVNKKNTLKKPPVKKKKANAKTSPQKQDANEKKVEGRLRPIVIDGSNVGIGHSRGKMLSVKGIKICVDYFTSRGHDVKVFLPSYRKYHPMTTDYQALDKMEQKGIIVFTPGRKVGKDYIGSYDDRFIVEYASIKGAIVITRDNYRDLYDEREDFKDTIRNRLLQYTFVDDLIMFPSDPLGRQGPHLDEFLRFPPDEDSAPTPIKTP